MATMYNLNSVPGVITTDSADSAKFDVVVTWVDPTPATLFIVAGTISTTQTGVTYVVEALDSATTPVKSATIYATGTGSPVPYGFATDFAVAAINVYQKA